MYPQRERVGDGWAEGKWISEQPDRLLGAISVPGAVLADNGYVCAR
jgi:hypothetical protein